MAGGELLEHDVLDRQPAALYALDDVLRRALRAGHYVHLRLEAHAGHADRLADALLVIDQELLRDDVQDLLVGRDGNGARGVDDALDVAGRDLALANRDDAVRVQAAHVAAGDARVDVADLAAGHQLGFLDRALDRQHGGLDVDHHALLQAARGMAADADDLDPALRHQLADDRDDLGGADVEAHDQVPGIALSHQCSVPHAIANPRGPVAASRRRSRGCSAGRRRRPPSRAA
jgi:hypothetical protein